MATVRTRFAPSPTGSLHVGGVRTALYCLLHAHKHGGQFVLRIEDTDRARSTDEATAGILRDMQWLGLQWDEGPEVGGPVGPYFQSERLDTYDQYVQQLLDAGYAYEAWDSREELDTKRKAAEANKETFKYRRQPWSDAEIEAFKAEGRKPVVRLVAPNHDITVDDTILGPVTVPEGDLDDLVIRKADGFPTYHFAVVVDDHLMGITQILRGQEHLMNTHKHVAIRDYLGWPHPAAGHMPLIFNPQGAKMSKRDKAKKAREEARLAHKAGGHGKDDYAWLADKTPFSHDDLLTFMKKKSDGVSLAEAIAAALEVELPMIEVMDFRKAGYFPEAIVNYMALLGWSEGNDREFYTLPELIEAFDVTRVNKTAARFDPAKIEWMNGEYMKTLSAERLAELHRQYIEVVPESPLARCSESMRAQLIELYRPRAKTFAQLDAMTQFFFEAPESYDAKAAKKWVLKGGGLENLALVRALIADTAWDAETLEAAFASLAEAHELGLGKLAQPLRVALAGVAVTPGLYDTLVLFERQEVLDRIDRAVAALTPAS